LAWKKQITNGVPLPTAFYVSPFTRALDTMQYTWNGLLGNDISRPLVIEDLREHMGEHTCDKRRTRSHIAKRFPNVDIEASLTEQDELWKPDHRETLEEHDVRTGRFLHWLFSQDWDEPTHDYVSITVHTGTVSSFLRVIGHRPFQLSTGGMIPVIIKAQRVN
jgi:hypothetical protein